MTLEEIKAKRMERSATMRKLRLAKGITQKQLASISGLSWPTIVRIENGKKEWRIDSEIIYLTALKSIRP